MKKNEKITCERSCGNVFADLEIENAEQELILARLNYDPRLLEHCGLTDKILNILEMKKSDFKKKMSSLLLAVQYILDENRMPSREVKILLYAFYKDYKITEMNRKKIET